MADKPADTPLPRPPSRLDTLKGFIGDLARPFAIIATASTTAWAILDPAVGADKLTAAGLILAALFGAKTFENQSQAKQSASVEIAKAASAPVAPIVAPPVLAEAGDLPPWERQP